MTVDVQSLSAIVSLAVTQAVQQAFGQVNKTPTPIATENELVEASVQDEVSALTEGTATNSKFTAQRFRCQLIENPSQVSQWLYRE